MAARVSHPKECVMVRAAATRATKKASKTAIKPAKPRRAGNRAAIAMRADASGQKQQLSRNAGADAHAAREHLAAAAKAAGWRVAKALDHLLAQVNALAPDRNRDDDGGIGDDNHQNTNSDHNPWVTDSNGGHVVTARDITHDPDGGCDCDAITAALAASRDARIKYIIWNSRILSATVKPWKWRAYGGANPHDKHFHISVVTDEDAFDDVRDWSIT
jgi:hypothetical protein